jgi:hypothetical protein
MFSIEMGIVERSNAFLRIQGVTRFDFMGMHAAKARERAGAGGGAPWPMLVFNQP